MRIQTREYIGFVKSFTEDTNIMTKRFFIVVPYTPSLVARSKNKGGLRIPGLGKKSSKQSIEEKSASFEENRTQIEQRIAVIEQGLARTGVRVVNLGTEEIIELFYRLFNPGELSKPIPLEK